MVKKKQKSRQRHETGEVVYWFPGNMRRAATLKRSPLKKMGKDKARETAKYWPLRRKYLNDNPSCEFPTQYDDDYAFGPSCLNKPSSIHHMKGQHWKIMNDTRYWMGLCQEHHAWIEDNKREARKRGLILYK